MKTSVHSSVLSTFSYILKIEAEGASEPLVSAKIYVFVCFTPA